MANVEARQERSIETAAAKRQCRNNRRGPAVIEGYTASYPAHIAYPYKDAWPRLEKEQTRAQEEYPGQFLRPSDALDLCNRH